ncbi:MAG TPA: hypothetical protein VLM42_19925 [Bryobacteraceae bacterium]|nr:hypothetical protein [Bryobacteraceae bacterium]
MRTIATACFFFLALQAGRAQNDDAKIALTVLPGTPLRVYLTKRVPKRLGAPVEGKLIEPVFAFDHEVLPAGSALTGKVSAIQPVSKRQRFRAMVNGDFTPLRNAQLEFDNVVLPNGTPLPLHTGAVAALNSLYIEPSKKVRKTQAPQNPNNGVLGTAKAKLKDQINGALNAGSGGFTDIVRGPNKKEKLVDFLWAKMPYHPQYLRHLTRIDAPLRDPLPFGTETVKLADLADLGSQPGSDSVVRARLLTALDSASAKQGQPVEAVLAAPLFSANHKLVLPQGTRLVGAVTLAKGARSFHRGGRLRFNFQKVELPVEVANLRQAAPQPPSLTTQATLADAEGSGSASIKVDSEGGVQAQESKTRFIAPAIALLLANKSADNDAGHHSVTGATGTDANVSGRTLGGGSGFGLLGVGLSQSSPYVGMAFGYYGLAWSVYSNIVAKGGEVQFDKNAMMDIRFGSRTPPQATKFLGVVAAR